MICFANGGAFLRGVLVGLAALLILSTVVPHSNAFAPAEAASTRRRSLALPETSPFAILHHDPSRLSSTTGLFMARDDQGMGFLPTLGVIGIVIIFVGTSFLPLLDAGSGGANLSIADSVVTKQDKPEKMQNYESKFDRLSRATIQEKLNAVPVFYLVDSEGSMKTDIFMSYEDAKESVGGATVKATTLDQVMYPLVLRRGRMRMAPPPVEVQRAEEALLSDGGESKSYRLIPSKSAQKDASDYNMKLTQSDIPLFVADRVAFAGSKGAQLPLFLEKADCVTTYNRLRESGGNRLPETPNIRTATLMDELYSMEKGTRPGVSQLAFYATAEDLLKATDMIMP